MTIDIANHAVDRWSRRVNPGTSFADARQAIQRIWPTTTLYYESGQKVVRCVRHHGHRIFFVVENDTITTVMTEAEMHVDVHSRMTNRTRVQERIRHHALRDVRRTNKRRPIP